jgi:hypothetical protein
MSRENQYLSISLRFLKPKQHLLQMEWISSSIRFSSFLPLSYSTFWLNSAVFIASKVQTRILSAPLPAGIPNTVFIVIHCANTHKTKISKFHVTQSFQSSFRLAKRHREMNTSFQIGWPGEAVIRIRILTARERRKPKVVRAQLWLYVLLQSFRVHRAQLIWR